MSAPKPGSDAAVANGCLCPVYDNARGAGWMGSGIYWISPSCPLHGGSQGSDEDKAE